jgi:hypothetical protein
MTGACENIDGEGKSSVHEGQHFVNVKVGRCVEDERVENKKKDC